MQKPNRPRWRSRLSTRMLPTRLPPKRPVPTRPLPARPLPKRPLMTHPLPTRQLIYTQVQQMLCNKVAALWSYAADHVDVATQQLQGFKPHPTTSVFSLVNATLAG